MSDTPRSDAVLLSAVEPVRRAYEFRLLCEKLERENAKLRADLATAAKHPSDEVNAKYIVPVQLAYTSARAEVDKFRADSVRLDWLEANMISLAPLTAPDMGGIRFSGQYRNPAKERGEAGPSYLRMQGRSLRATIDAALTPAQPAAK